MLKSKVQPPHGLSLQQALKISSLTLKSGFCYY